VCEQKTNVSCGSSSHETSNASGEQVVFYTNKNEIGQHHSWLKDLHFKPCTENRSIKRNCENQNCLLCSHLIL